MADLLLRVTSLPILRPSSHAVVARLPSPPLPSKPPPTPRSSLDPPAINMPPPSTLESCSPCCLPVENAYGLTPILNVLPRHTGSRGRVLTGCRNPPLAWTDTVRADAHKPPSCRRLQSRRFHRLYILDRQKRSIPICRCTVSRTWAQS